MSGEDSVRVSAWRALQRQPGRQLGQLGAAFLHLGQQRLGPVLRLPGIVTAAGSRDDSPPQLLGITLHPGEPFIPGRQVGGVLLEQAFQPRRVAPPGSAHQPEGIGQSRGRGRAEEWFPQLLEQALP